MVPLSRLSNPADDTSAKVDKVEKTKTGIAVTIMVDGKQQKIDADKILIAVGRKPRTQNIGLEKTKIKPDREFIKTDSWMQTVELRVFPVRRARGPGLAATRETGERYALQGKNGVAGSHSGAAAEKLVLGSHRFLI